VLSKKIHFGALQELSGEKIDHCPHRLHFTLSPQNPYQNQTK